MTFFRAGWIEPLTRSIVAAALIVCALHATAMGGRPAAPPQRSSTADPAPTQSSTQVEPEAMLVKTLLEIRNNRLDAALIEVNRVLQAYPNFRLAHLIRGDILLARAQPLHELGEAPNAPPDRIQDLRDEARVRLARVENTRPADRLPKYMLQLSSDQQYVLIIDTKQSTLYVFENQGGTPKYVADYYISVGKNGIDKTREGDKKTPLGVYHVTANLPRAKLGDFYGVGAFPISYPNEWDRREGRNGQGIWLHGVPSDTYSRPPRASDGCVVLTNQDLENLGKNLRIGVTPVIIADGIEWVKPDTLAKLRQDMQQNIEKWREDWESRNTELYLKHYSPAFYSGSQDLTAWGQQKRQVNASKAWIKVKLDDVSIYAYPGRNDLAVVTFVQDYTSSNLSNKMRKRQYWINQGGAWHILYEGAA